MSEAKKCSGYVSQGRMGVFPCTRKGKVKRGKEWYCVQHDPERIAKFEADRSARWEAKWAEEKSGYEKKERIHQAKETVIEAAKGWREWKQGYLNPSSPAGKLVDAVANLHKEEQS